MRFSDMSKSYLELYPRETVKPKVNIIESPVGDIIDEPEVNEMYEDTPIIENEVVEDGCSTDNQGID